MTGQLKRDLHPQISVWLQAQGLPNLSALAKRINPEKPDQMHVYRVLGNQQKHKSIMTLLKLSRVFCCDLDTLAEHVLDYGSEYTAAWIRLQMIKNQISTKSELEKRSGLPHATVFAILNGDYEYIQINMYRDIARNLDISLVELMATLLNGTFEGDLLKQSSVPVNLIPVIEKTGQMSQASFKKSPI